MSNDIIATIAEYYPTPLGAIYRGKDGKYLKIEFKTTELCPVIKEKLVETKQDGSTVFRKKDEKSKTSSELIKEGKAPFTETPKKEPKIEPKIDDEGEPGGGKQK
jgi:hypothetical protein